MPYILPKGTYYDAGPHVHVDSIECVVRPEEHVLADNWKDNPMDENVCWRKKTVEEKKEERAKEIKNSLNVYQIEAIKILIKENKNA